MVAEQVAKALETKGQKKYGLPLSEEGVTNPFTKDIIAIKLPPKFVVPQRTANYGKTNSRNHIQKHVTSLLGRGATEEIQCLLFLET